MVVCTLYSRHPWIVIIYCTLKIKIDTKELFIRQTEIMYTKLLRRHKADIVPSKMQICTMHELTCGHGTLTNKSPKNMNGITYLNI